MSFEEKIDAMRMTRELAMHDLEAAGVKIEALRGASANKSLNKITGDLGKIADSHDRRIGAIEGRA